jgi:hemolysin III
VIERVHVEERVPGGIEGRASGRSLRELAADQRPLLRGVLHQYSAALALAAGGVLMWGASSTRGRIAVAVYTAGLTLMFAMSGMYHRVAWRSEETRRRARRLDRSTIYLAIAGTYTPVALFALQGRFALVVLVGVWSSALVGTLVNVLWIGAPRWLVACFYVSVGWFGLVAIPQLVEHGGRMIATLLIAGGALYSLGAVVYAAKRPDPSPRVFGYHEVFHALVFVAAALHVIAVAAMVA